MINPFPAVQITEPEPVAADESQTKKQFPAGVASRRLSGRPPLASSSSRSSLRNLANADVLADAAAPASASSGQEEAQGQQPRRHRVDGVSERLIAQVAEWLEREKVKKETRKGKRRSVRHKSPPVEKAGKEHEGALEVNLQRSPSADSFSSEASLDRLQRIIYDSMSKLGITSIPRLGPHSGRRHHRKSSKSHLTRTQSSDTEYFDGDVLVPSCDGVLDNSKTLSYAGGKATADDAASISSRREAKEKQAWTTFKNEIIRLAHTLRLKGWRQVPLDSGESIAVERLSGALTNAVYVVSPPEKSLLVARDGKKPPKKILLRIYGPQVEHLIDRETELSVLRRLARKKIGPRLLGTFVNGRFEQFFNAVTLTPSHLREPETSKQIAKRMRELHDGISLLEEEKDGGPAVWNNWDKWLSQTEKTVQYLDEQILSRASGAARGAGHAWRSRGLVCGVEWPVFKAMVEKYREFVLKHYGGMDKIRSKLVFAHNDTQYGNILRIRPDDEKSPLLQPSHEHRQLIVIDFEYAAANTPGLEFANHFSEWTYNYHDPTVPYACDATRYPTPEQQHRFIKAYVDHQPPSHTPADTPSAEDGPSGPGTPALRSTTSTTSIADFMLDARAPPGGWKEEELKREADTEQRVSELLEETRLWRIANSAQWIAWGIVQAKIPGFHLDPESPSEEGGAAADGGNGEEEENVDEDAFDYLGYAQERARWFWGDCVLMGLVKKEELPEELREKVKLVEY
ncbi:kinase-like domain-containing protein [Schizothecium vesticola]|uniref:Kinase-like domain-containing protein n=1 Tax=Schizothecium vesticola TaxID=314040 RepID=A0AA40F182_9PEZI|nr:kinase-like domain-containing protein [Schizothecium vesticola]